MYALVMSLALLAQTDTVNTKGLSDAQRAELQLQAERMKAQVPGETIQNAREWVDLGTALGQALGGSARELGIATNEFAMTPVGKVATVLIVWKIMGRDIVHLVMGPLLMLCLLPAWWYFYRRTFVIKQIEYGNTKEHGFKRRYIFFNADDRAKLSEGQVFARFAFGCIGPAIVITGICVMLT